MTSAAGVPNVFLEFGWLQIIQILQTCHKLFTVEHVLKNVEIWQRHHAYAVLNLISQVFGDITVEHDMPMLEELSNIEMDWEELKDHSSLNELWYSHEYDFDETETSVDSNEDGNDSFLENLAVMSKY